MFGNILLRCHEPCTLKSCNLVLVIRYFNAGRVNSFREIFVQISNATALIGPLDIRMAPQFQQKFYTVRDDSHIRYRPSVNGKSLGVNPRELIHRFWKVKSTFLAFSVRVVPEAPCAVRQEVLSKAATTAQERASVEQANTATVMGGAGDLLLALLLRRRSPPLLVQGAPP